MSEVALDNLETRLAADIDRKTKPPGSLGLLEEIALRLGVIQKALRPQICRPTIVVFAADHGLAQAGVSPYPQVVTRQMVLNFVHGGAAINALCRCHGLELVVADVGVAGEAVEAVGVRQLRAMNGTANALTCDAMKSDQVQVAMNAGALLAEEQIDLGSTLLGFGEMGIGNTSVASLIVSAVTGWPLADCVGRGTGHDDAGLQRKLTILMQVQAARGVPAQGEGILAAYGGCEIAAIVGAMRACHGLSTAFLVDGFIATAAFLVAQRMEPEIARSAFFAHASEERAHRRVLQYLNVRPILDLGMRLGEGTGAAMAVPVLRAACAFVQDMASFDSAGVSDRD